MNVKCKDIMGCIEELAPLHLAEAWDNPGLIIGSAGQDINSVLLCLDVTLGAVNEACRVGADMIVSHHPMIFSPLKRIDVDSVMGRMVKRLLSKEISVYCAHTNIDKAHGGLNDLLLGILGLLPANSLNPSNLGDAPEPFRIGNTASEMSFEEFCTYVLSRLKLPGVMVTGGEETEFNGGRSGNVRKVAVMCGSYDISAETLIGEGVDAIVCGELKHHQALELNDMGIGIVAAGHHGTERFFVSLAEKWIKEKYPDIEVFCYGFEAPPLKPLNQ